MPIGNVSDTKIDHKLISYGDTTMPTLPLITGATGLNTATPAHRIKYNAETGFSDLAVGVNIQIRESHEVSRCDPTLNVMALTVGHSAFCQGRDCVVADGTSLYKVNPDKTLLGLRSGMNGAFIDYEPEGDAIYYCNGGDLGVIINNKSYLWNATQYDSVETDDYFEETIPEFEHICIHNSHMLGAVGNAIYISEYGDYGLYNAAKAIVFNSKVLMIYSTDAGFMCSDEHNHYFFSGLDPFTSRQNMAFTEPALEWSLSHDSFPVSKLGLEGEGECRAWLTRAGLVAGTPTGQVIPLTRSTINYPGTGRYGATLVRGSQIISTMR